MNLKEVIDENLTRKYPSEEEKKKSKRTLLELFKTKARLDEFSVINEKIKENNFNNWLEDIEEKQIALNFCKNFAIVKEKGLGLLLSGSSGVGKTFLADCIYNELQEDNVILRTTLSYLLQILRETTRKKTTINEMLSCFKMIDLFIIDDLGNENITEWGEEIVFSIFDFIYSNKKSLIITTNFTARELMDFLRIKGNDKIYDRLMEILKPISYKGKESKRKNKNIQNFKELF